MLAGSDLCVSVGWCDMRTHAKDPGYEHKEDLNSLTNVAAMGGFTDIALLPNTKPVVQTKEGISYFKHFSAQSLVQLHPMAAVTINTEGKDFTEMLDLHHAGAVAFTDGEHPIDNADIFLKTLQYLEQIDGLLVNRPEEKHLAHFGQIHEGFTSMQLGLKGIPALAEEMMIHRDLKLLEYANIKSDKPVLHFATVSTKEGIELIRNAKTKGLPVSCDVAAHQLAFDDTALEGFETNLKVSPPFRSADHVMALWEGLLDGTVDAIVSDHNPQDEESKNIEFDAADFGIIALETVYSILNTLNEQRLTQEQIIEKLTQKPRQILRLKQPKISVGETANLTVFSPSKSWTYSKTHSKSKNTPLFGLTLQGAVLAVFNNNRYHFF
jgi:dihydroorotase